MILAWMFAVVSIAFVVLLYNSIIFKRNLSETAWSTVDVFLKKRFDTLNALIRVVRAFAQHEASTLEKVVELRSAGVSSKGIPMELNPEVSLQIRSTMTALEAYPEVKASQHFLSLQRTIIELEDQISAARRNFNSTVTEFNNGIEMFPHVIVARLFGFSRKNLIEFSANEKENPDLKGIQKAG